MSIEHYFFSFRNGNLKGKKKTQKTFGTSHEFGRLFVEHSWFKHWKVKSVYWNDLSNTL